MIEFCSYIMFYTAIKLFFTIRDAQIIIHILYMLNYILFFAAVMDQFSSQINKANLILSIGLIPTVFCSL